MSIKYIVTTNLARYDESLHISPCYCNLLKQRMTVSSIIKNCISNSKYYYFRNCLENKVMEGNTICWNRYDDCRLQSYSMSCSYSYGSLYRLNNKFILYLYFFDLNTKLKDMNVLKEIYSFM